MTFGGISGTNLVINSPTSITVAAPDGSGSAPVTVQTPDGTAAADTFTFTPVTTGISPGAGIEGTAVTITGTGLGTATGVDFGSTPGAGLVIVSVDAISVTVPPGSVHGRG